MGTMRKTIGFKLIKRETIRQAIIGLNTLSQAALILMMFLTAADVILRYFFNSPIFFSHEISEFLMVVLVSLGLSYCAIEKGHVSVDVLKGKLPKRWEGIFYCFTSLLTVGFFLLIVWRSFVEIRVLSESGIKSMTLGIPRYPFVGLIGVGFGLFTIVILMDLIDSIYEVFKK
ncbi:MAG: TRAP transporter small permease [Deltaproteobacteria bacterium]|nr:TRAP transporter small permease [Deltaproteobacteria bacterium]